MGWFASNQYESIYWDRSTKGWCSFISFWHLLFNWDKEWSRVVSILTQSEAYGYLLLALGKEIADQRSVGWFWVVFNSGLSNSNWLVHSTKEKNQKKSSARPKGLACVFLRPKGLRVYRSETSFFALSVAHFVRSFLSFTHST